MADIAQIGIRVDTSGVERGAKALDQLTNGATRAESAIKRMSGATSQTAQGMSNVNRTIGQAGDISKQTAFQMRQLSFQMNDVATGLLSGQSPFQVLAQQGGQVYQALQMGPKGVGGSIKEIGRQLRGVITPARVAGGALTAAAVAGVAAWNAWDNKIRSVQQTLNGLGRVSGATSTSIVRIAQQAAGNIPGLSMTQAMQGATSFAGAGIDQSLIGRLLGSSKRVSGATGMALGDSQSLLAQMFKDPTKGIGQIESMFGPVAIESQKVVVGMQAQGRMIEAQTKLLEILNKKLKDTTDTTGILQRAWDSLAAGASSVWNRAGQVGARQTPQQRLAAAQRDYDFAMRSGSLGGFRPNAEQMAAIKQRLDAAKAAVKAEDDLAKSRKKEADETRKNNLQEQNRRIAALTGVDARSILARTSEQRLAANVERLRQEAIFDTTKKLTLAADIERQRTLAIAEATKASRDHARALRDEMSMPGSLSAAERVRRQTAIEFRNARERTGVLGGGGVAGGSSGMNGAFMDRLKALMAAVPGVSIGSGFRSNERQAELFAKAVAKYGSEAAARKWVAPPGHSMHNVGLAADLRFASPEARREAHRRAGEFGLRFRMGHEPWHVEPSEGRGLGGASGGARPLTVNRSGPNQGSVEAFRIRELWEPALADAGRALQSNVAMLKVSVDTFGQSTEVVARETERRRLLNMVIEKGVPITADVTAKINALAEAQGRYAAASERVAEVQRKAIEGLDMMRESVSDLISGPLKDIAAGRKPGEAFRQAGLRLGGRLIDQGANGISSFLLGDRGKPGGGLFGSLLGRSMQSAMMNVKAGVVNVQGGVGLGGAVGGSGGIGGFFSSLFSGGSGSSFGGAFSLYANGGVMTSKGPMPLKKYSTGGVANSPQMALFGEGRTPEAYVPLPDGKNIPVKMVQGRQALRNGTAARSASPQISMGGISVNVQGNADDKALQAMEARLTAAQAKQMQRLQRNFGSISGTYQDDYL